MLGFDGDVHVHWRAACVAEKLVRRGVEPETVKAPRLSKHAAVWSSFHAVQLTTESIDALDYFTLLGPPLLLLATSF